MRVEEVKKEFSENYGKYFPAKVLESYGFKRFRCKFCGNFFWSLEEREYCDEPECREKAGEEPYSFIGKPVGKRCSYQEAWRLWEKCFKNLGHAIINRYPVIPKWRDDIFFVEASIDAFIPWVVEGIAKPPANPLLIPQFCLRFNDLENVGVTGRHYSGFIMIGQHAFNSKEEGVYFMDEAIEYIIQLLTKYFQFPLEEIRFHEGLWHGSASLGSSLEFFVRGLELGNQVYTLYRITEKGLANLPTKVIDMGAGLERYPWITNGYKNSYLTTFPKTLEYLRGFGIKEEEQAILADHFRSLLVAIWDGALPSNTGGGYNLRRVLRRCLSILRKKEIEMDLGKLIRKVASELCPIYPEFRDKEKLRIIQEVIEVEKEKYLKSLAQGKRIIKRIQNLDLNTLVMLYQSHGIDAEIVKEVRPEIKIPEEYWERIGKREKEKEEKLETEKSFGIENFPNTEVGYYEDVTRDSGRILKVIREKEGAWILLDRTIFFPIAAGQDCDQGWINGKKVRKVIEHQNKILHLVEGGEELKEGEEVELLVDERRREEIRKHHTSVHILNGACKKILGFHANQAGVFKTENGGHLDIFHFKSIGEREKEEIEELANRIVKENREVRIYWMEREEAERRFGFGIYQGGFIPAKDLRIVEIEGFDVEACSGLHCRKTGEIEEIVITGIRKVADNIIRIEFKAGKAAKKFLDEMHRIANECSEILECGVENLPEKTQGLFEEWKRLRKKFKKLSA